MSMTDEERALAILTRFVNHDYNYYNENGTLDGYVPQFSPEDADLLKRLDTSPA